MDVVFRIVVGVVLLTAGLAAAGIQLLANHMSDATDPDPASSRRWTIGSVVAIIIGLAILIL